MPDAFETRLEFVGLLKRLTSSMATIQRVVAFAIRYADRCADDLWDCLLEELQRATVNVRINLFFALDALLDVATNAGARRESVYLRLTKRDLARIIELVVPEGRDGVLNGPSASQILAAWRTKRLFGPEVIGPMETLIGGRTSGRSNGGAADEGGATARFSRNDILRRIEDDRERHKRLRERLWILPIPTAPDPPFRLAIALPTTQPSGNSADPSPHTPLSPPGQRAPSATRTAALCIDLEVEQLYERLGPLDEQDLAAIRQSRPTAPIESR